MLARHLPLPQCQIPMPVAIEEMHICRNLFFFKKCERGRALQLISMLNYVCIILYRLVMESPAKF